MAIVGSRRRHDAFESARKFRNEKFFKRVAPVFSASAFVTWSKPHGITVACPSLLGGQKSPSKHARDRTVRLPGGIKEYVQMFRLIKKFLVFLLRIVFKNDELKMKPGASCVPSVSATANCIPSLFANAELGLLILFKIDLYEIIFILERFLYSISYYGSFFNAVSLNLFINTKKLS